MFQNGYRCARTAPILVLTAYQKDFPIEHRFPNRKTLDDAEKPSHGAVCFDAFLCMRHERLRLQQMWRPPLRFGHGQACHILNRKDLFSVTLLHARQSGQRLTRRRHSGTNPRMAAFFLEKANQPEHTRPMH